MPSIFNVKIWGQGGGRQKTTRGKKKKKRPAKPWMFKTANMKRFYELNTRTQSAIVLWRWRIQRSKQIYVDAYVMD